MRRARSLQRLIVAFVVAAAVLAAWPPAVKETAAATYRTWVAQAPAAPTNSDTVTVWMNSDTAYGETAGVEYRIGGTNVKVLGTYDTSYPGANWRAHIPAQPGGTFVEYQLFTRNEGGSDYGFTGFNWSYTVSTTPGPISVANAKALWLETGVFAWNGAASASYKLLYDPNGGVEAAAESTACSLPAPSVPCYVTLTESGTISGYVKNPNATGLRRLTASLSADAAKNLLQGQVVVASYAGGGGRIEATRVQVQSVLDHLYVDNGAADDAVLGVTYSGSVPTVRVWAPTAKSVTLRRYASATGSEIGTGTVMTLDTASGVWSATAPPDSSWDRQYYLFDVEVYVPSVDQVVHNLVTDPYAITLSTDTADTTDPRSQFVNLNDNALKPADWGTFTKPPLANFEDIVIYETHIRDFSIDDPSVTDSSHRGTYLAFTYDGRDDSDDRSLAKGMEHLQKLQAAGLTHIHLLPTFDIASVPENSVPRTVSPNPTGFSRSAQNQQATVAATRTTDGFNWGYDPYHYGAPEGSFATNPDGAQRVLEFREMVKALSDNGLRVVMDVVYNHTAASGQADKSVLDRVVPGYYYRYTTNGALYTDSCCDDTASEYAMFEKLMIDTLKRWAIDYKVDGFRFDLMNFHTRQNMLNVKNALSDVNPQIYLYGEGWDFGSAAAKGLTTCPNCYAKQANMTGTGIGSFNDKLRDAAHGGYSQDDLGIRKQGYINGLSYDWNGFCYAERYESDLIRSMDVLRSALRGSGTDWNNQGQPFTDDPQESVPYVEKHDNETLFDQNVFKLPNGSGSGMAGWCGSSIPTTSMADRVRVQNLGTSLVALAQGVPFFQMGQDVLRSKSLDRNSYDSGDWFNRVDWSYGDGSYANNFAVGLPPSWDNESRWDVMTPLLDNTTLDPASTDAQAGAAHMREMLRIRKSSPLFRLTSESEINTRTGFYTANAPAGLLVMSLKDDAGSAGLDPNYGTILVFFNANKTSASYTVSGANGFTLHPVHTDTTDADPIVQTASFNDSTDTFTIPARTTAVFVSTAAITPPLVASTIDWVGLMWPRGGSSAQRFVGGSTNSFDVYVQVYEPGITGNGGSHTGIACTLYWGKYGATWTELPMSRNDGFSHASNDEHFATISQAALNALTPGQVGFTAYCEKSGEDKKWKVDSANIGGQSGHYENFDVGDGIISITPSADVKPAPPAGVFVHLFEWRWTDIQKECSYLASKGYTGVQVSPPMEHLVPTADQFGISTNDFPWWVRYQPVSYSLAQSRSGTLAEFQAMINACNAVGVDIIADAVINHMTGPGSSSTTYTGTAGSPFRKYQYPYPAQSLYGPVDFHSYVGACPSAGGTIENYKDRRQVQRCELSGLSDLNTSAGNVQAAIRAYLQSLLDMRVKGFRIDGAKHIAAHEIADILNGLTGDFYVFQEVIDYDTSEPVKEYEYFAAGDVTEFGYSIDAIGKKFNGVDNGKLADLANVASWQGMMDSKFALIFTDNHDNQRGHGPGGTTIVDHRDGQLYNLANIFMLGHSYGDYVSVMSSYYWSNDPGISAGDSKGPPSATPPYFSGSGPDTRPVYVGNTPANCSNIFEDGKWVCEHRRTPIANMVRFRWVTYGEPVTKWSSVSNNHIAFGRGSSGFVAINREAAGATTTYDTDMPAGTYCDVIKYDFMPSTGKCVTPGTTDDAPPGDLITVDGNSDITNRTLNSMDAFAIHVGARLNTDYGSLGNSYGLPWHTEDANTLRLGPVWRTDDGVTRNSWASTGSVNLTVNGATGYVTSWFDWNQDGDFADSGEMAFANEPVTNGETKTKTFTRGSWNYAQPLNARFRVYTAAQTLHALAAAIAPDATPQPTGGATGGEAEDYSWTFNPLAVTLADFSAVQQGDAVLLTWETNSELNNRGFNLYRGTSDAGWDTQLNDTLIPSQSQGNPGGFLYTWEDRLNLVLGTTYYYWVEDVDIYGVATIHGPVSVDYVVPTAVTLSGLDASSAGAPGYWLVAALAALSLLTAGYSASRRREKITGSD